MVNHFYVYCVDRDFGPFFLKFCTYFPYTAKLCLNGHEYLKRRLTQRGVAYEALDNGVLSCEDPRRAQALCDGLSASTLDALLRKWLWKLPHPYSAKDRRAEYRYQVSILQAEFSLTQVLDRPVTVRTHDPGITRGAVLLPHLHPALATYPRRHRSQRAIRPLPYPRCLREASNPHRPSLSGGTTRRRINLTHLHHSS
ncbi:MAG: hypothetical protein ACREXK_00540, partial [Gammaproteobacteria bacterium]